jgi:hypothetical protein
MNAASSVKDVPDHHHLARESGCIKYEANPAEYAVSRKKCLARLFKMGNMGKRRTGRTRGPFRGASTPAVDSSQRRQRRPGCRERTNVSRPFLPCPQTDREIGVTSWKRSRDSALDDHVLCFHGRARIRRFPSWIRWNVGPRFVVPFRGTDWQSVLRPESIRAGDNSPSIQNTVSARLIRIFSSIAEKSSWIALAFCSMPPCGERCGDECSKVETSDANQYGPQIRKKIESRAARRGKTDCFPIRRRVP